ncbi:YceI family protein [Tunturiibacter lichenicola]|uniref:YceI family protein n=1 Tax=Tunturiibacter lichenicola TaxID=2051959 RepID=UPI0021B1C5E7|nr:YceI family protein [Edaphobacter lichenicola]
MNRRLFTAALSALLLTGVGAFAQTSASTSTWTIDSNHAQVNFAIKHGGVSTVRGSISGVTGEVVWDDKNPSNSSVQATINATTVTTNNDKRDGHLKSPDFFNVEKFPTLTFKSTSVTGAAGSLKVVGDLTLAGVTKSVTLDVDGPTAPQKGQGGKLVTGFSATGTLKRSDFNFGSKFGSPILGDDVKFTIDVEASK